MIMAIGFIARNSDCGPPFKPNLSEFGLGYFSGGTGDGEHAEVTIGDWVYRVRMAELA